MEEVAAERVDRMKRRLVLSALGGAAGVQLSPSLAWATGEAEAGGGRADPQRVASDEAYWAEVAQAYDRTDGITNLEHGYWGRMARPVRERYLANLRRVDVDGAWYARRHYADDHQEAVAQVAATLGAQTHEIALTRNATEAIHNLIRQHRHLTGPELAILHADIDYPPFKRLLRDLADTRGLRLVQVELPSRADGAQILARYRDALDANPDVRLMLATHASNQHGLVLPIAAIAALARERGVDVVCDAAQSWGLVDYRVGQLGIDWAGFNLHKWIGAPLGLGALYMRAGTLDRVAPYPGEAHEADLVASRVHTGTSSFASVMTIPAALDWHRAVGGAYKEARLRYLRGLWTEPAQAMAHIEVLGGLDEASWSGIGSLRLRGRSTVEEARALQGALEEAGVFTVIRVGLQGGACVRVTPQVFTQPAEMSKLVDVLRRLRA
ncbi:MAG: aminotransferase class V-fold PLP-dependent enzyme [Pseudomonadota bacterium]